MASKRAAGLKDGAYPIWDWLARHHPLDQRVQEHCNHYWSTMAQQIREARFSQF
jgi:hypothetical protein